MIDESNISSRLHFHIGKGGVGKSTTAALTALYLAQSGCRVLLVSMDPAHNQRDIFAADFSEKPQKISANLSVKEVEIDVWTRRYLKQTQADIQRTYAYQSAFNLDKHLKLLQYSPGLEEYALLRAFEDSVRHCADRDVIVFDMAPTALTLKFFSLPCITLVWLRELLKLRQRINAKKEIVSKIKIGKKELERDRVKSRLEGMIATHEGLRALFLSNAVRIHLVMNDDHLSFAEARRIKKRLMEMQLTPDRILVNKLPSDIVPAAIQREFGKECCHAFPFSANGIVGMDAMRTYIVSHPDVFKEFRPV